MLNTYVRGGLAAALVAIACGPTASAEEAHHWSYKGHGGYVSAIAFSPDGRWVASGDNQKGKLHVWDAATGAERWATEAHLCRPGSGTVLPWTDQVTC